MARSGITYEQVQQAAEQLIAEGNQPSQRNVRAVLGTGSASTIAAHLRNFQAERAPKISDISDGLLQAIFSEIEQHTARQVEDHEKAIKLEQGIAQDALMNLERAEAKISDLQHRLDAEHDEKIALEATALAAQTRIDELKATHKTEIAELKIQYEKEISALKSMYETKLADVKAYLKKKVDKVSELEKTIAAFEAKQNLLSEQNRKFDQLVEMMGSQKEIGH